jgi:hypothetical protein
MPVFCVGVSCFVLLFAGTVFSMGIVLVVYSIKNGFQTFSVRELFHFGIVSLSNVVLV